MKKIFNVLAIAVVALAAFSCKQKDKEDPTKVTFTIATKDVTYNAATITVSCSDANTTFYWDIISSEDLKEYGSVAEYLKDYFITKEYYEQYKNEFEQYYGITSWKEILEMYQLKGTDTYSYTGLSSKTEYVIWACAVDSNLSVVSDVQTDKFTTLEVKNIDLSFQIGEDENSYYFMPSSETASYFAEIIATDSLNAYGLNAKGYFAELVDYMAEVVEQYGASYGISWADILYTGSVSIDKEDLIAGQEMHFIAAGCVDGIINSEISDITFTYIPTNNAPSLMPAHIAAKATTFEPAKAKVSAVEPKVLNLKVARKMVK